MLSAQRFAASWPLRVPNEHQISWQEALIELSSSFLQTLGVWDAAQKSTLFYPIAVFARDDL